MFTGIVGEVGQVGSLQSGRLTIRAAALKGLEMGASVAVNGACLTVAAFDSSSFTVELAPETLRRTNLGELQAGDRVNLERALGLGGELGGHLVQGHIDATGTLAGTAPEGSATLFRFEAPPEVMEFLVEKGFIAVEGVSLTIAERGTGYFQVSVVDYTKNHTNLAYHQIGDRVNLEIDIMAKYVKRFLEAQRPGISADYLKENGF
jgi:riboflavin synthase